MSWIDGNVTELAPRMMETGTEDHTCWVCQSSVSRHMAFCAECHSMQPPRQLDHYARLGIDRRFDLDSKKLHDRYKALKKLFMIESISAQGPRFKQLALDHLAAVEEAFITLKDPARRAIYLLKLLNAPYADVGVMANSNDLDVMRAQLVSAKTPSDVDRVAFHAGQGIESCIRAISQAFKIRLFSDVGVQLARLTQLEKILSHARDARQLST